MSEQTGSLGRQVTRHTFVVANDDILAGSWSFSSSFAPSFISASSSPSPAFLFPFLLLLLFFFPPSFSSSLSLISKSSPSSETSIQPSLSSSLESSSTSHPSHAASSSSSPMSDASEPSPSSARNALRWSSRSYEQDVRLTNQLETMHVPPSPRYRLQPRHCARMVGAVRPSRCPCSPPCPIQLVMTSTLHH
jgi:hypothetical protein